MPAQSVNIHELFQQVLLEAHATWRYRWQALVVAWLILLVGAVLVFSLPNKYQASAQIYADTDALMNPLLSGFAVQPNVGDRLQIITHTLLSRPNLETVADSTGLSLRATTPQDRDALLVNLGREVRVESAGVRDLYNIRYTDPNPQMSQRVVQAFVQILMNDTLGANIASTNTAKSFLQEQLKDYSNRLNDAEQKLADFKKANVGYIPNEGGSDYFTRLQAAQVQLQSLQDQYDTEVASRVTIEQQMQAMQTNPASSGIDPRIQELDSQIAAYTQKLNSLLLTYTDDYPDVMSARRMIAQLQARRAALEKPDRTEPALGVASANPVYQEMQKGLYTAQVTLRTLATKIDLQKRQIAELKSKTDRTTDAQATLQRLTRNYDATKSKYNELLERVDTAQMSQDAAHSGNNLKFRVIDPPIVPLVPVGPNRGMFLVVVFLLAIALGSGFAYFLHKINPVFSSLQSLRVLANCTVLGAVSFVFSDSHRNAQRLRTLGFYAGAGLLVIATAAGLAFSAHAVHLVQHFFVVGKV